MSTSVPALLIASVVAIALTISASRYAERPVDGLGFGWVVQLFKFTVAMLAAAFAFIVSIRMAPWARVTGAGVLVAWICVTWRSCG